MKLNVTDEWQGPIDVGSGSADGFAKILQVQGGDDVFVRMFEAPDGETDPKDGFMIPTGEHEVFGHIPGQQIWLRAGGTSKMSEVYIGPWQLPGA
jgi:hypothetical protein